MKYKWLHQAADVLKPRRGIIGTKLCPIKEARQVAYEKLTEVQFPTNQVEEYRFTNLKYLSDTQLKAPSTPDPTKCSSTIDRLRTSQTGGVVVVIINGVFSTEFSLLDDLPEGLYIGSFPHMDKTLNRQAHNYDKLVISRGGPFALLNSATAEDVLFIIAEPGLVLTDLPVHLLIFGSDSSEASPLLSSSTPRIFISVGKDASLEVVEEYVSLGRGPHMTNSVSECHVSQGSRLLHRYVQLESSSGRCYHFKSTLVDQQKGSYYGCTEARLGSNLSRHDLLINQLGSQTKTEMSHFVLAGKDQLHDLHSKLQLDNPKGIAEQLHKSILTHSTSRCVFDGNVKVNSSARFTDAQQLSRNLLLAPKATVNLKPNLQIIADEVKCTHGCAVSDLDENEMFYFTSRGIDKEMARQAMVYSFGHEILRKFKNGALRVRIETAIEAHLASMISS
jgi:Fe-S cluster assembly protein SufD